MKHTPLPPRKKPLKRTAIKRVPKGATTIDRLMSEGKLFKASSLQRKPKPIRKRKPRKDGMTQPKVFAEVWAERDHACQVCHTHIEEATLSNFSHLLGKGAYPSMKFDKRNIEIWCKPCHDKWTDKVNLVGHRWDRVRTKCMCLGLIANNIIQ